MKLHGIIFPCMLQLFAGNAYEGEVRVSGSDTPKAMLVIIDFNYSIPDTSFGAITFLQLPG